LQEPALSVIPGGVSGFQSAISESFFPYQIESVRSPEAFESATAVARIGTLRLSRTYVSHSFSGGRLRSNRSNERNAYVLMMVEEGLVQLRSRRAAVANSGDLILLNTDHALESHQEKSGFSLAVSIPAPMLRLHYAEIDDWCLIPLPTSEGSCAILRQCLTTYWRAQPALEAPEYNDLAIAMIHLIGACFRRQAGHAQIDSRSMRTHFLRVRALVEEHLVDPDLSADTVAAQLGISKGYLFMVMNAANTTLGRFILDQRLERSRQVLSDPATKSRTISEIAFSLGFQDLSHFSRRFTEKFGRSPRAYRVGAQSVFAQRGPCRAAATGTDS
jgi:AraC-like DNA-binding protein